MDTELITQEDLEMLQDLERVLEHIETRLPYSFWECNCDPITEWDTNAVIHNEQECATVWEEVTDTTSKRFSEWLKKVTHSE